MKWSCLTETSVSSGDAWKEAVATTHINRLTSLDFVPEGTQLCHTAPCSLLRFPEELRCGLHAASACTRALNVSHFMTTFLIVVSSLWISCRATLPFSHKTSPGWWFSSLRQLNSHHIYVLSFSSTQTNQEYTENPRGDEDGAGVHLHPDRSCCSAHWICFKMFMWLLWLSGIFCDPECFCFGSLSEKMFLHVKRFYFLMSLKLLKKKYSASPQSCRHEQLSLCSFTAFACWKCVCAGLSCPVQWRKHHSCLFSRENDSKRDMFRSVHCLLCKSRNWISVLVSLFKS